jgi:hypothetical protein
MAAVLPPGGLPEGDEDPFSEGRRRLGVPPISTPSS